MSSCSKRARGTVGNYYRLKHRMKMPKLLDAQIGYLIDSNRDVWGWCTTERNIVLERVIRLMAKTLRPAQKIDQSEFKDIEDELRDLWEELSAYQGFMEWG